MVRALLRNLPSLETEIKVINLKFEGVQSFRKCEQRKIVTDKKVENIKEVSKETFMENKGSVWLQSLEKNISKQPGRWKLFNRVVPKLSHMYIPVPKKSQEACYNEIVGR